MVPDMKYVSKEKNDNERAYYASRDTVFTDMSIKGPQDGESAFKESQNIIVNHSEFELRYPFWHNKNLKVNDSTFASTCRAAFWYDENVEINNSRSEGVKAFRECSNLTLNCCDFTSEEIFWRCNKINASSCTFSGAYAFFESKKITINSMNFTGKYSFQYVEDMVIDCSFLNTKDAFWHSKNVTVRNSTIKGEYLGWYSENLTLINCTITGTQPLCYTKNLKLQNCSFEGCDLAFEYSEVNGSITGSMVSIKNPLKGKLTIEKTPEMIVDENDRGNGQFSIEQKQMNNSDNPFIVKYYN